MRERERLSERESMRLDFIFQLQWMAKLEKTLPQPQKQSQVELEPPLPSAPDRGTVAVTVEVSPCAGPQWFGRLGEERAAEVAAALTSALGGVSGGGSATTSSSSSLPPALDLRALCVAKGAAAWHLKVSCLLLSLDGTSATLTAASAAVAAALADTRVPAVTVIGGGNGGGETAEAGDDADSDEEAAAPPEIEVEDDLSKATAVDASRVPVFVTIALAASSSSSSINASSSAASVPVVVVAPFSSSVVGLAADPDAAEEAASRSSVSVAVDAFGVTRASFVSFCGGSRTGGFGGSGGMSPAQLSATLSLARNVGTGIAREVAGVSKEAILAAATT